MSSILFMSVIVPLCILLPLLIGLIKYNKLSVTGKIVFWYLVIAAIINTAATITARVFHTNNLPLSHLLTVIEMSVIAWLYTQLIFFEKYKTKLLAFIFLFSSLCVLNAIFFQSIFTFSSYTRSIESIICLFLALNYYAKLAAEGAPPLKMANFYFNTGIFLYFSGALMLFIFQILV